MNLTSKQRAYLKGLGAKLDAQLPIGKAGITPEIVQAAEELFHTHELIKGAVLKNCELDVRECAETVAERTHATVVHTIGRKFVLYKPYAEEPEIVLP